MSIARTKLTSVLTRALHGPKKWARAQPTGFEVGPSPALSPLVKDNNGPARPESP